MQSKNIFIDVTDFLSWKGHFTGIQRVVYNISKEIISNYKNSQLIVFYKDNYIYLEQSLDNLIQNGLKLKHIQRRIPTREERLKNRLIILYLKLPKFVQKTVLPTIKIMRGLYIKIRPIIRTILHYIRSLYVKPSKSIKNNRLDHDQYGKKIKFRQNDQMIGLGCFWEDPGHLDALLDVSSKNNLKLAVFVHDLMPIYLSHTFGDDLVDRFAEFIFNILQQANFVFAVSQSTANDLEIFKKDTGINLTPLIKVIRLGDSLPNNLKAREEKQFINKYTEPFIICVGTIEARKNHTLIYKAFKLAEQKGILNELPILYIIGKPGWLAQDVEYFFRKDIDINKKVKILNNISDKELAWLYKNAMYSLYVSQYEGWGLPVAESLVYNTPCITSNVSSMTEIAPGIVDSVSPYDPAQLLQIMMKYSNSKYLESKRRDIKLHYKSTSWKETTDQIFDTIGSN